MRAPYPSGDISQAVKRLDEDIVEAERHVVEAQRHLDELRTMRKGITPFLQHYVSPETSVSTELFDIAPTFQRRSLTDRVVEVFLHDPDGVLDLNTVVERIAATGADDKPSSIRNAVYYAARSGRLEQHGNGRFALGSVSTRATTEEEGSGEPLVGPQEVEAMP
ncbi:hypothetical protein HZU40_09665 [Mycolicibacterium fluoranthenivorans]|uniref:Uncharacterized protein n=1 Tax=Mycolicibacterium fluoranthenivorans TaxID=258505 RepID=A0A7G8PB11_9MYCO|nr:hypothetical protein [Mycolicibacterium fluoranthenivorans]QNJ91527.1 hypothetical protein HZU40_25555 [Mycolicibacterium fluoranthenivorans]QNJ94499.1 hypothetical protein HZU40_09665 [Mycolicibacterium fluoranthenivorans]